MKFRILFFSVLSLSAVLYSANAQAFGCVATSVHIQGVIYDSADPPPKQSSQATHIQGENCFANTTTDVISQIAVGNVNQDATSIIVQDSPSRSNPLTSIVPDDTGNVSVHVPVQVSVGVPLSQAQNLYDRFH